MKKTLPSPIFQSFGEIALMLHAGIGLSDGIACSRDEADPRQKRSA